LRLEWTGRAFEPGQPTPRPATRAIAVERAGRSASDPAGDLGALGERAHRIVFGDALDVAGALAGEGLAGRVDLVYVDPPFASQVDYQLEARLDGPADGRVHRAPAYVDSWSGGVPGYLDMLAPRLDAAARLLAPTGTLWVHVDWRASYLVRLLLDEILGRDAFLNEIVWRRAPNLGRQAKSMQFGRTLDTLIVYGGPDAELRPPTRLEPIDPAAIRWDDQGRPFTTAPRGDYTDASIARLETEGRVHRTASGKVYIKYFLTKDAHGVWCRERRVDALWTDVPPLRHVAVSERTGYPTQKPRALLERIVACASPPGGLVVDLFAGSGTTAEAAHAQGRRSVSGDVGAAAVSTARARLLRAGASVSIERCDRAPRFPVGRPPRVKVSRAGAEVKVRLVEPAEPLAWAVGTGPDAGGPLETLWHSERIPGARAVRARVEATLPAQDEALTVRVFHDDGTLGTASHLRPSRGPREGTRP
jgi:DNA modification methylase